MSNIIAIDIGNESMRVARWKESRMKNLASSSELIANDYQRMYSP